MADIKKFLDADGVTLLWNKVQNNLETAVNVIDQEKADISYVDESIANAGHLTRKIVTEIPTADTAEENVIYMFKVEDATGNDKYQEYILSEGEVILIGDTSVDLTDYAKIEDDKYSDDTTWSSNHIYDVIKAQEKRQYLSGKNGYIKISACGDMRYYPARLTIINKFGEVVEIYGSNIGYTSPYQENSYKAVRLCYGNKDSNDATIPSTYIKKIIHDYTYSDCFYVQIQGIGLDYQVLGAKDEIEFVADLPVSDKQVEIPIAPMFGVDDEATSTATTWSSQKISDELAILPGGDGSKTYTTLSQLGLIAPVTVGDIFNAMSDNSMAIIACEDIATHITDVPVSFGVLTIKKNEIGRFSIDYQTSLASAPCNVKKWIGTLKGDDGTGLYWKEIAYKDDINFIYRSLSELGLDTTATLKDITRAMANHSMIAIKVDAMADQSEYNNIAQGTVTIYKIEDARIQAIMTEKSTGKTWVGILGGENTIIGWKELRSDVPYYRIVTQGTAGYFKFKASDAYVQSLNITATDNYGGCIVITGQTTSDTKYYPFKAVRLSNGDWYHPLSTSILRNKIEKLYYYDGYLYLKVANYATLTFTGLSEAPIYVETLDNTDTEIPIVSLVKGTIFTSLEEMGLTADATIDDVITALSNGDTFLSTTSLFTNYETMFPNTCHDDAFASVTIRKYDGRPFIMWYRKDGKAYAFGGVNSAGNFLKWSEYRFKADGYANDSIICIGDTASADGVIQTLTSLGFTGDVMTWDTGEYRISHVTGITNLPAEITEAQPGFRLAHYDVKKWGGNHNPYSATYGCRQSVLHYKGDMFIRYTESGATAGVLIVDTGWQKMKGNTTLVANTATLKLDVTKKMAAWYGAIKLTYLYDTSPVEVEIDFRAASDPLKWTIVNGQKYIKAITYTQDADNKAHYTIGIEFNGTTYGCYQAEVIGGFANINSLTKDAFTGDSTAVYGNSYGKNNGVTLVSAPEDLGLTSPCTTVELVQAMRNTFNKTITSGAIGVFNNGGQTITDAPSEYGLLHIETFGHDRVMIRYDGIAGSSYTNSWIGQIQGSNGTFSGIKWKCISQDIPKTDFTMLSGTDYKVEGLDFSYVVKNGICQICGQIRRMSENQNLSSEKVFEGLPIPAIEFSYYTITPNAIVNSAQEVMNALSLQVRSDGSVYCKGGTLNQYYLVNVMYPVAD